MLVENWKKTKKKSDGVIFIKWSDLFNNFGILKKVLHFGINLGVISLLSTLCLRLMLGGFVATRHKFEFIRLSMNENGNFTELFQSKIAIQGQP